MLWGRNVAVDVHVFILNNTCIFHRPLTRQSNIDILLFGNDDLSVEINTFIFSCVQTYIKDTRRFA
jgi:hypothetical protein